MPNPPVIVFDLDGTLIDSREDLTDSVNAVRILRGLPSLPLAQVVSYLGDGQRMLMTRAIPGLDSEGLTLACRQMSEAYQQRLTAKTRLYPGVLETLPLLAQHYRLCVVSNKNDDACQAILQRLEVSQWFSAIVGGGRTQRLKPDPEPILLAARLAQGELSGGWVVGDHRTDLAAASALSMHACFCAYGFGCQDQEHADAIIPDFSHLTRILL